jgi:hypothetical protein
MSNETNIPEQPGCAETPLGADDGIDSAGPGSHVVAWVDPLPEVDADD